MSVDQDLELAFAECFGRPLEMRGTVRPQPKSHPGSDGIGAKKVF